MVKESLVPPMDEISSLKSIRLEATYNDKPQTSAEKRKILS
jgi:hypothetical protein